MGLDIVGLRFLKKLSSNKDFCRTVMLGRQNCHVSLKQLRQFGWDKNYVPNYSEEIFIDLFGSIGEVSSIDNSKYEDAKIIMDMNENYKNNEEKFDTFIDLGSLEHIFDIKTALKNIIQFVKIGGQIIHVLPANNFCGHGFYQFSPELFYSFYSEKNGFKNTKIFITKSSNSRIFYKVVKPENGRRTMIYSLSPLYICISSELFETVDQLQVQQSDFTYLWQKGESEVLSVNKLIQILKKNKQVLWNIPVIGSLYKIYTFIKYGVSIFNPGLKKIKF